MTPEELTFRIDRFFGWYSQRVANLQSLSGIEPPEPHHHEPTYEPEQHVLIGAGLDSLAKHWADAFPVSPKLRSAGDRMQAFLAEMANSKGIWERVAAPMLRAEAVRRGHPAWAEAIGNAAGSQETHGSVRGYESDLPLLSLVADPRIRAARVPVKLMARFQYGQVLYREYRCTWIHEFDTPEELAPHGWDDGPPRYQNLNILEGDAGAGSFRLKHRLVFSLRFLLDAYAEAVDSFKARCVADRADPCGAS